MRITKLEARRVEKVWGRRDLPEAFGRVEPGGEPIGEIWFEHPERRDLPLLVKYLFTSDKLSVQVHPGDAAAKAAGYASGKEEAWLVLRAEPGAAIGLGLREAVDKGELRAAALDGSIERLLDWRPAAAGDYYYSPAGTVHAIGAGVVLIEIQQNVDLTYRLYDYGRPRELHLEEGVAAANPRPYQAPMHPRRIGEKREILAEGLAFVLERRIGPSELMLDATPDAPVWLVPVLGNGVGMDGLAIEPGGVWLAEGPVSLSLDAGAELLLAYPGADVQS
jgi:mannose-6-phosphate isomerase